MSAAEWNGTVMIENGTFFEVDMQQFIKPPVRAQSDYIEIGCLATFILLGGLLNLYAFYKSLRAYRQSPAPGCFLYLKLHLNVADLFIIFVYALSELIWISVHTWEGGSFLCKLVKYLHMLAFYLTSNIVICIAANRVYIAFTIQRIHQQVSTNFKWMMAVPYMLAILFSSPQIIIWKVYHPYTGECKLVTWSLLR